MPVLLFTYVSKYPDKMSLTSNKQEKLFKKNVENLIFSHFYANWRNPVQKGEVKNGFYSSKIPYPMHGNANFSALISYSPTGASVVVKWDV